MPFDGSGNFTRLMNWVADAAAGIKIKSDRHDQEDDNFAQGLSNVITKDGQTVVTANIPFNGKRLTGVADPSNDQDAVTKKWIDSNVVGGAHIADTAPAVAKVGQLWWDSGGENAGNLFLRVDDGTSTQWIQVNVGTSPYLDQLRSLSEDMSARFKTAGKFVINDKVDGTGTDVLTMTDAGAMTVTGDINGGNAGFFAGGVRAGPATGTRSLLTNGGLQLYNDATYPLLVSNVAGTGYVTIGSSGAFNIVGGTFAFQGAGTSRMTINQTGYVNIPAPSIVSYALDVRARTDYSGIISFLGNTSYYGIVGYSLGAGYSFYGNVSAFLSGGTWATSDIRAKTGMRALDPMTALDKVKAIGTYLFTFKMDGTLQYGFSAQQVREFIPEAVRDVDIPDHDTAQREAIGAPKSGDATVMAINDRNLLATLWAAVQALTAKVEELEAR